MKFSWLFPLAKLEMSLVMGASAPQPILNWYFENSNVESITGITPSFSTNTTSIFIAPTYTKGIYNQGISLLNMQEGSASANCYIVYNNLPAISVDNGVTLAFWINPISLASVSHFLIGLHDVYSNSYYVNISPTQVNVINTFPVNTSVLYATNIKTGTYTSGVWYHIAFTYNSTQNVVYVNGVGSAAKATVSGGVLFTCLRIGSMVNFISNGAGFNPINGVFDDIRIYNTALSAAQIQSIYAAQGAPSRAIQYALTPYATGGTVTTSGGDQIHTYTAAGADTFVCTRAGYVQLLVVAGGGGGGSNNNASSAGGGGGAGEVFYSTSYFISPGVYTIVVGAGGIGGVVSTSPGTNGGSSSFGTLSANGGGFGGNATNDGNNGGSGGGGGRGSAVLNGISVKTAGGLGNNGGVTQSTDVTGAGGGGATSAGAGASGTSSTTPIAGGTGYTTLISGTSTVYGAGGTGGARNGVYTPSAGTVNRGNGGDGAPAGGTSGSNARNGADGGRGIIIVRYTLGTNLSTNMRGAPIFSQLSSPAVSSVVGAFSFRAVNGTSTKAVAIQARPVVQWPPTAMTSNSTVISAQTYGNGTYTASSSNLYSGTNIEYKAFDYNPSTYYEENFALGNSYNNAGNLINPTFTQTTVSGATAQGEWLQIQFPTTVTLRSYTFVPRLGQEQRSPRIFWIAGSTDGTTWSNVNFQNGITSYINPTGITFNIPYTSNTIAYSYYRVIVNAIVGGYGGNQPMNIASWNLYGDSSSYTTTTQDFYADRLGNLLTAPVTGQTLANWLGTSSGYVTTWYGQYGTSSATQSTAANQCQVVAAGNGGLPQFLSSGSSTFYPFSSLNLGAVDGSYTKAAWVNVTSNSAQFTNFITTSTATSGQGINNLGWAFPTGTATPYATLGQNTHSIGGIGVSAFPFNTWTHLACTYSNPTRTMILYINGSPVYSNTAWTSSFNAGDGALATGFRMGRGFGNPTNATAYDILIFNSALSSADISVLYNNKSSIYAT